MGMPDTGELRSEPSCNRCFGFRVAMRPGKRWTLPDTPEGRADDLIETAKAHICAKAENPFHVINKQSGFQATWLRELLTNRCKVSVLAALLNLLMPYQCYAVRDREFSVTIEGRDCRTRAGFGC